MNIDFVRPGRPSRRSWMLASLPMAVALILWCVSICLRTRLETGRGLLESASPASRTPAVQGPAARPPSADQRRALAVAERAAMPQAEALAELERVAVIGIQLRSIDFNPAQAAVVVEFDAATDDALGDYLDQLNAGDSPPKWHIQKLAAPTNQARVDRAAVGAAAAATDGHVVGIARRP